jgi:hypothetical protein
VLAEFVIAVLPLLMAFFVFFQVGMWVTAKMFVRHATIVAARAGIVVSGGGASNPMLGGAEQGSDSDVQAAFQSALGVWGANGMLSGTVAIDDPGGPTGPLTATSTVVFTCRVPLGKLICANPAIRNMQDIATLLKQGARYK